MSDSSARKRDLRKKFLAKRGSIPQSFQNAAAKSVCDTLLTYCQNHDIQQIGLYHPMQGELDILCNISDFWAADIDTYLPTVNTDNKTLTFWQYTKQSSFQKHRLGMQELAEPEIALNTSAHKTLVITPLVAIDLKGNRLGYGGGYYDRYFAAEENMVERVGVGFNLQLSKHPIPSEAFDIPLSGYISEAGLTIFDQ